MNVSTTGAARSRPAQPCSAQRWPGDPSGLTAAGIDFEALAHVLANTCRWGGRTRRFYSVAQRAIVGSEAIEALDGLEPEERRALALRTLLADARIAWLGDTEASGSTSARAAESHRRNGAAIDRAVLEAAGVDGAPTPEQADLLRFVARMTDAAERRDFPDAEIHASTVAGFPPLKRRIRPVEPGRAARLWLARLHALGAPPPSEEPAGPATGNLTDREEKNDVAHLARTQREETRYGTDPESQGRARAA